MNASRITNRTTSHDMAMLRKFFHNLSEKPEEFPVTYTFNGEFHHGLPENTRIDREMIDANIVRTVYRADAGHGLAISVECLEYRDFPVIEWTVWFKNEIQSRTPVLADVLAADFVFPGINPVLTSNNGDFCSGDGYTPCDTLLLPGTVFTQSPTQGRSCNEAFPYQRLIFNDFGVNIAIGWPGGWSCRYEGTKRGAAFQAGQAIVHTFLEPGEKLRTPRITIMPFTGDASRGVNLWRRWFFAHVLPRQDGQPLSGKRICMESGGGIEFTEATEENQLHGLDRLKVCGIPCDVWWIDAGWYPCRIATGARDWTKTGTWEADKERFPSGLGPVGRKCGEMGIDFLLWCEPERVQAGTWLADHHPEWLLHTRELQDNMLLNLGDPGCLEWICTHFDNLIKESGIRCYRQDFNIHPDQYWRDNEIQDRTGMVENKYVQGYLAFWDHLLLTHPGLFIDSCASGGRRNDLETLRRSVPLHHTDYGYGNHPVMQAFQHTLNSWIPYYRGFMRSWDDERGNYAAPQGNTGNQRDLDNFMIMNSICPAITVRNQNGAFHDAEKRDYLLKMLDIWAEAAPLIIHADFYALTANHRDSGQWTVFQFDDPEERKGMFQVIRNIRCGQESITVMPSGIRFDKDYRMVNKETGASMQYKGSEIINKGLIFTQPARSGAIWFYDQTGGEPIGL